MSHVLPPLYICRDTCECLLCKIELSVAYFNATGTSYTEPARPTQAGANIGSFTNGEGNRRAKEAKNA